MAGPAQVAGGAARAAAAPQAQAVAPAKERLMVQALDTGRPEEYDHWRLATKAEIVGRGAGVDEVMAYVRVLDDSEYEDSTVTTGVQGSALLRALDASLYAAILQCVGGVRKGAVLDRMHATVPFGSGGLALRFLDREFQRSTVRAQVAATREILNLSPQGHSASALDAFLARYRALLAKAGAGSVGKHAQVDVLMRATQDHPVLGATVAAWRQHASWEPSELLERLEDVVAESRTALHGGRGASRAWAALDAVSPTDAETAIAPRRSVPAVQPLAWAAAAAPAPEQPKADNRRCYACGQAGHISRDCPRRRSGAAAGAADPQAELLRAVRELTAELRARGKN